MRRRPCKLEAGAEPNLSREQYSQALGFVHRNSNKPLEPPSRKRTDVLKEEDESFYRASDSSER